MKKEKKKSHRYIIILMVLIIGGGGVVWYYQKAMKQRSIESPTTLTKTSTKPRYSLSRIMKTVSLFPDLYNNTFARYNEEKDYGTYVIPGLEATRTLDRDQNIAMCTSMTPQGIAVIENYVLVSSYCKTHEHDSVIHVIDKLTHQYLKEIVLPGHPHGGSIAYDVINKNIFICSKQGGEAQVVSFALQDLENYSLDKAKKPISYRYKENIDSISSNSFMTYYDGYLYMGYFSESEIGVAEKFLIQADGTLKESVDDSTSFQHPIALLEEAANIPDNVQGMTFEQDKLLLSISNGPFKPSSLRVYKNGEGVEAFNEKNLYKEMLMPERMEQIYIDGYDLYVIFESASNAYHALSITPCDRILKLDLNKVLE